MSDKALRMFRLVLRVGVAVVALIVAAIGLGVLLRLLNANPEAGFTDWAYGNQDVFMPPFENVFDPVEIGQEGHVLDASGLFAMAVYACLFIPLGVLLGWVRRSRVERAARREQELADAQRARIFGEPTAAGAVSETDAGTTEARPSLGQRLRARLGRSRGSSTTD